MTAIPRSLNEAFQLRWTVSSGLLLVAVLMALLERWFGRRENEDRS